MIHVRQGSWLVTFSGAHKYGCIRATVLTPHDGLKVRRPLITVVSRINEHCQADFLQIVDAPVLRRHGSCGVEHKMDLDCQSEAHDHQKTCYDLFLHYDSNICSSAVDFCWPEISCRRPHLDGHRTDAMLEPDTHQHHDRKPDDSAWSPLPEGKSDAPPLSVPFERGRWGSLLFSLLFSVDSSAVLSA